jgi:membrane protease YdiL (CAAX protease family)
MPLSVLMTWVYNKNDRSILAVILLHFTYNFTPGLLYPFSAEVFLYQVVLLFMVAVGVVTISDGLSEGR